MLAFHLLCLFSWAKNQMGLIVRKPLFPSAGVSQKECDVSGEWVFLPSSKELLL